jgi:hypothetical protein
MVFLLGNMFAGFGTLFYGKSAQLLFSLHFWFPLHPPYSLTIPSRHPLPQRNLHPQRRSIPRPRRLDALTTKRRWLRRAERPQQFQGADNRWNQWYPDSNTDTADPSEQYSHTVFVDTRMSRESMVLAEYE